MLPSNWRPILPRLKRLSGQEVVAILRRFGFEIVTQRGSHIKLRRVGLGGQRETMTIPDHPELDTGTCRAILRQAQRFIPSTDLAPWFFSE
ncbi:MAG TPA: type II toxin-antitoxin system HicA family toxin [Terriglobia bacterium]|nr:type II toxin-antitoxin system HicA family toxin [Terriglobia bacterium]